MTSAVAQMPTGALVAQLVAAVSTRSPSVAPTLLRLVAMCAAVAHSDQALDPAAIAHAAVSAVGLPHTHVAAIWRELCERCERVEPTTDQWRALVTYLHGSGARLLGDVWGVTRETP